MRFMLVFGQHIKSLQHRGEMVRDEISEEISKDDLDKALRIICLSWLLSLERK